MLPRLIAKGAEMFRSIVYLPFRDFSTIGLIKIESGGYRTIVFIAALANINPSLYEAAEVDGASRWKQTRFITIPSLVPMAIVVGTLSLGNILNAGFDQIFNLYNGLVMDKGDIIDTFVYRTAILEGNFSFATAVGLFKSVISMILIVISYRLAYKLVNYRVF
ncbi:ABC transporter permease subunit [Paenibacillus tarimensis]